MSGCCLYVQNENIEKIVNYNIWDDNVIFIFKVTKILVVEKNWDFIEKCHRAREVNDFNFKLINFQIKSVKVWQYSDNRSGYYLLLHLILYSVNYGINYSYVIYNFYVSSCHCVAATDHSHSVRSSRANVSITSLNVVTYV